MFRNDTRATERRPQRAKKKLSTQTAKKPGAEPCASARVPQQSSAGKSPFELAVIPAIQIPTEVQSSCHFVSNFVLLPRQGRY